MKYEIIFFSFFIPQIYKIYTLQSHCWCLIESLQANHYNAIIPSSQEKAQWVKPSCKQSCHILV